MPRPYTSIRLPASDQIQLERWVRARTAPQRLALRSRIILSLAKGLSGRAVAEQLGISRHTVDLWRVRYLKGGRAALLQDKPGRGRKPSAVKR